MQEGVIVLVEVRIQLPRHFEIQEMNSVAPWSPKDMDPTCTDRQKGIHLELPD